MLYFSTLRPISYIKITSPRVEPNRHFTLAGPKRVVGAMGVTGVPRNAFLELPIELRVLIYGFAIEESDSVTISSAQLSGSGSDIVHRLYDGGRSPLPGLPLHHEPIILPAYSSHLLSATDPPRISVSQPKAKVEWQTTKTSLRLVNQQLNAELKAHCKPKRTSPSSLFINYPHGLHVLQTMCPDMLEQAKSVHIAGVHHQRPMLLTPPQSPDRLEETIKKDLSEAENLRKLIRATMGRNPTCSLVKFELRMYFPNSGHFNDSYRSIWHEDSPVSIVLQNMWGASIDMECWRGRNGNAVHISARPKETRVLKSIWRGLREGGPDEPKNGSFVVDENWPLWSEEHITPPVQY